MRAIVMLALVFGCGDALVTKEYRGDPIFTIEGRITDVRYEFRPGERLQASIFWSLTGDTTIDPAQLVEQTAVAVRVTFPSAFKINIFDTPEVGSERPYWLGQIMVYEDEDQSGSLSPGELRGGAAYSALLFATRELSREESPTGLPLPSGFTIVNLPLPCEVPGTVPPLPGGADCDVPVGAPCLSDGECGSGVCLDSDGYITFPGGYCSLSEGSGCVPANGQLGYFYVPPESEDVTGFYYQSCISSEQCREGYECFSYVNACLPKAPVFIDIFPEFTLLPLCE
jgi:hypothetical protein